MPAFYYKIREGNQKRIPTREMRGITLKQEA